MNQPTHLKNVKQVVRGGKPVPGLYRAEALILPGDVDTLYLPLKASGGCQNRVINENRVKELTPDIEEIGKYSLVSLYLDAAGNTFKADCQHRLKVVKNGTEPILFLNIEVFTDAYLQHKNTTLVQEVTDRGNTKGWAKADRLQITELTSLWPGVFNAKGIVAVHGGKGSVVLPVWSRILQATLWANRCDAAGRILGNSSKHTIPQEARDLWQTKDRSVVDEIAEALDWWNGFVLLIHPEKHRAALYSEAALTLAILLYRHNVGLPRFSLGPERLFNHIVDLPGIRYSLGYYQLQAVVTPVLLALNHCAIKYLFTLFGNTGR
jgi:hypothetical protein